MFMCKCGEQAGLLRSLGTEDYVGFRCFQISTPLLWIKIDQGGPPQPPPRESPWGFLASRHAVRRLLHLGGSKISPLNSVPVTSPSLSELRHFASACMCPGPRIHGVRTGLGLRSSLQGKLPECLALHAVASTPQVIAMMSYNMLVSILHTVTQHPQFNSPPCALLSL